MTTHESSLQQAAEESLTSLAEHRSTSRSTVLEWSPSSSERFGRVHWSEPPSETSTPVDPSSSRHDDVSEDPFEVCEASVRFQSVPWHASDIEEPSDETNSEWNEQMKVKNFFDGLS